jgi:hypothetical protein
LIDQRSREFVGAHRHFRKTDGDNEDEADWGVAAKTRIATFPNKPRFAYRDN